MKRVFLIGAVISALIMTFGIARAQDGDIFVVISGRRISNVVVVAKSGGQYKRIQDAIDHITDASLYNPYLVVVGPGVYNESVTLKPSVHLQGAGKGVTIIRSDITSLSFDVGTVVLADSTSVRDLTIWNFGTGDFNVGLKAFNVTDTIVSDVEIYAPPAPVFPGAGGNNYGVVIGASGVTLDNVTAVAQYGTASNFGLWTGGDSTVNLHGGSFTGRGGDWGIGISQGSNLPLTAMGITAIGEGGTSRSYGLWNQHGDSNISQSVLKGDDFSVYRTDGTVTLTHTRLIAPVSGTCTCVGISEGTTFYSNNCP